MPIEAKLAYYRTRINQEDRLAANALDARAGARHAELALLFREKVGELRRRERQTVAPTV